MQTYGPFYPSVLANESNGGVPWSISGVAASASVPFDGVTDFLKATGFGANIPSGKTIKEVRLQMPNMVQGGKLFNNSDQYIVGPQGEQQAWVALPIIRVEPDGDGTTGLTPAAVNASDFGFKFAVYNGGEQGVFNAGSLALYVDVE